MKKEEKREKEAERGGGSLDRVEIEEIEESKREKADPRDEIRDLSHFQLGPFFFPSFTRPFLLLATTSREKRTTLSGTVLFPPSPSSTSRVVKSSCRPSISARIATLLYLPNRQVTSFLFLFFRSPSFLILFSRPDDDASLLRSSSFPSTFGTVKTSGGRKESFNFGSFNL
jgi:hypothetical protein